MVRTVNINGPKYNNDTQCNQRINILVRTGVLHNFSIKYFLNSFLNLCFVGANFKKGGKLFHSVPPEKVKLDLNRLLRGLGKESLWECLFLLIMKCFTIFFGAVPFIMLYIHTHLLKKEIVFKWKYIQIFVICPSQCIRV